MSGSIRLEAPDAGWLEIPEGVSGDDATGWVEAVSQWMQQSWGERWDARADAMVPAMLHDSVTERPDAHYVFDVWPLFQPLRLRVQISVLDPSSLPDWQAEGYSIVGYDDAPIGPGIQCVRMHDLEEPVSATVVEWCAVFTANGLSVVVLVEPAPLELLTLALPGLHAMIGTLEVQLPGGAAFHAEPSGHAMVGDDLTWASLRLQEAGLLPDAAPDGEEGSS